MKKFILAHKLISTLIVVFVLGGGYYFYRSLSAENAAAPKYVVQTVSRGTLVISVTGSGQVSVSNQVDIKPKASGDVTWVGVKKGDTVRAGQALAQIDNTDAKQAIADAEQSLAQAKLQFQKDSAQAPIDYQKLLEALDDAKTNISTTYNDIYNTLSSAYLDLPGAVTGMQNILYGYDLSKNKSQWNIDVFRDSSINSDTIRTFTDVAERDYKTARAKYDQAVLDYKTLTRYSSNDDIEKLLTSSIDTTTAIAQALQGELNLLDAVTDDASTHDRTISSTVTTMRTNVRGYLSTANSNLSALFNQQKSLDAAKKIIRDDERNIEIYKIGNSTGDNPISLQSSQYSIADQERKLQQLKDDLANYVITAPFAGTLAVLNVERFDTVSTGSSVATLITKQKIAEISLNEIDVAKVKAGQKVTLTFDAVPDLTITGQVAEVDTVGTVSQGVVNYAIKITFDTQDDRVKSGMSATAAIVLDVKTDVLLAPNSAVKSQGGNSFIQVPASPLSDAEVSGSASGGITLSSAPVSQPVSAGLSNDTATEILSGLKEGDQIIIRTINSTSNSSAQTQQGGLRIPGLTGR